MKKQIIFTLVLALTLLGVLSIGWQDNVNAQSGDTYWVSPGGKAAWINCRGDTPLNNTSACSLNTANQNAEAGNTVLLRGGNYGVGIAPANSGTAGSIIVFKAFAAETPILSGDITGIRLQGKSYIKIQGITVNNVTQIAQIVDGAHYNEISDCILNGGGQSRNNDAGILIRDYQGPDSCTHNWLHDNIISNAGWVNPASCNDEGYLIKVGNFLNYDRNSGHNTIENNVMYHGGHHVMEVSTNYNVIRDNTFYNWGWMDDPGTCQSLYDPNSNGNFGNRNLMLSGEQLDNNSTQGGLNLIEANRFGHAGRPPDDDGANNLAIGTPKNIIRYNSSYNAGQMGMYFRDAPCDGNHVYNNTLYHNGHEGPDYDDPCGIGMVNTAEDNIFVNNIIYDSYVGRGDWRCIGSSCQPEDNNTFVNNRTTTDGNPQFVDPDTSDVTSLTKPDLRLMSGSSSINAGVHLTLANGSGDNFTRLVVDDAGYFQDGTWGSSLSNIQADWIAIGTVDDIVQIESINYDENTIVLAKSMTWVDDAPIWLYKDSTGEIVLIDSSPDIGAYEFTPSLDLRGRPADQAILLDWTVNIPLPITTTNWLIDYYTQTNNIFSVTNLISVTNSAVLTNNVINYQTYTVTLYAMPGKWLSDTVHVMPTDRLFVYLPIIQK